KYGIRNWQGGGRASARETIGRVAAGAIARKIMRALSPDFELIAYVNHVYDVSATIDPAVVTTAQVEGNVVRCPDANAAQTMIEAIEKARADGDSLGGTIA